MNDWFVELAATLCSSKTPPHHRFNSVRLSGSSILDESYRRRDLGAGGGRAIAWPLTKLKNCAPSQSKHLRSGEKKKHLKRSFPPFMFSSQTDQARYIKPWWCRCASYTLQQEGCVYLSPASDWLSAGFTKTTEPWKLSMKLGWRMTIIQDRPH